MAKTVAIKIPDDIEYRVIGNAFCLLIASAGLLAGEMLRQRSLDYWLNDIVPLVLVIWIGFRLFRNFLSTMTVYQHAPPQEPHHAAVATAMQNEEVIAAQIPAQSGYSADKVIAEVAKRIEDQKANAIKKNKFTN